MLQGKYHPHLTKDQEDALRGCTTQGYYNEMCTHFEAGTCPLCKINHKKNTVLFKHERWLGWLVGGDFTTRQQAATQLLFFPRDHLTAEQLTREHWSDQHEIHAWVTCWAQKHGVVMGGGIASRFGPVKHNVGTVPGHFHLTYYLTHLTGEVIVPFAKDDERFAADTKKMLEYQEYYEANKSRRG